MSKHSLRKSSELPKWFKQEKYRETENFSLNDWHSAFSFRSYIWVMRDVLSEETQSADAREAAKTKAKIDECWSRIVELGAGAHRGRFQRDLTRACNSSVTCLEVGDIFVINDALKHDESGKYKSAYAWQEREMRKGRTFTPPDELLESAHDAIDPDCFWLHQVAFAKVDLQAADSTIIENFSVWLRAIRAMHRHAKKGRERRFSERDCSKWHNAAILQYLDLHFWAEQEGVDIPDWLMGDAIFPVDREINTAEAIRKTTYPLAERIWTSELEESLAADISGQAIRNLK